MQEVVRLRKNATQADPIRSSFGGKEKSLQAAAEKEASSIADSAKQGFNTAESKMKELGKEAKDAVSKATS